MTTFLEIRALENAEIESTSVLINIHGKPYHIILKAKDGSRFEINFETGSIADQHLNISHFPAPNSPDRLSGVVARVNAKPKLTRIK